ncbi:hypothetical protein GCM10008959_22710 [Deinococcus seoulensis]|uniref:Uncharacterized protein n=2 Tax=Deinococcus TaxID=1298 RepID=A0ABQ2RVA1_9DEIO|nr:MULTISPECIES: hypothetical protein [Deinococcus]GGR60301.1 hypothetical protein GCM10008959_22710 [Deinococcus seoulensis]GGS28910.1 hypothetical protein GCM10008961_20780 [Deinococcus knuensis]
MTAGLSATHRRILAAMLNGTELLQRPGEDWELDGQRVPFSDLQVLWDAQLVTFRLPMTHTAYLNLTPEGAAALGREAAD